MKLLSKAIDYEKVNDVVDQERCVCKSGRRSVRGQWHQGQYLARPDAGADCVVCDPLSAHLGGCHGHGFSQPQQVQRL